MTSDFATSITVGNGPIRLVLSHEGSLDLAIRTPGPPPFSLMNTAPAASCTWRIISTVRG